MTPAEGRSAAEAAGGAPGEIQDALTPPAAECKPAQPPDSAAPIAIAVSNSELIETLVDQAFANNLNCRKVFTGNRGSYEYVQNSAYARTFARSFAKDLCSPQPGVGEIQRASPGNPQKDALALERFSRFAKPNATSGSVENLIATYSLSYSLALRESSGNFSEGKDATASNNTLLTEEAGAFQVSSNTLGSASAQPGSGIYARRAIFAQFLAEAAAAKSLPTPERESRFIELCGLQDADRLPRVGQRGGNRTQGKQLEWLNSIFSSGQHCAQLASSAGKNPNSLSTASYSRGACFIQLQKKCPAFAIQYNTVTTRTLRRHFGPLNIQGPTIRPQCRGIFETLVEQKDQVCRKPPAPSTPAPLLGDDWV